MESAASAQALPEASHQLVIVHSAAAGEAFVELTQGLAMTTANAPQCGGPEAQHSHPIARSVLTEGLRIVATTQAAAEALQSLGVEVYATASGAAADAVVDAAIKALENQ